MFQQFQTKLGSQEDDPCCWIPSLTSRGFGVLEFQVGFNLLVEIPGMENKSLSTIWAEAARAASKPHKAITFHMVSSLMAENIYLRAGTDRTPVNIQTDHVKPSQKPKHLILYYRSHLPTAKLNPRHKASIRRVYFHS